MRWPILVGRNRTQPLTGVWHDWKQPIADECGTLCVYCAVPEARLGGLRSFHVEHFRPKSKFPALENAIGNLFLACGICNVLKSDDWPADPSSDHSVAAYPDPALSDYNVLLSVLPDSFEVDSQLVSGRYLIERVMLNRAQLVVQRRLSAALAAIADFETWLTASLDKLDAEEMKAAARLLLEFSNFKTSVLEVRPYQDADTKRPIKPKAVKKRSKS
jgi:hypothetical protein